MSRGSTRFCHVNCTLYIYDQKTHYSGGLITPADWPRQGAIVFDDVSVRYADDLEPVLSNINLTINPREKVRWISIEELLFPKVKVMFSKSIFGNDIEHIITSL